MEKRERKNGLIGPRRWSGIYPFSFKKEKAYNAKRKSTKEKLQEKIDERKTNPVSQCAQAPVGSNPTLSAIALRIIVGRKKVIYKDVAKGQYMLISRLIMFPF